MCVIRGIPVAVDLLERVSVRCWAGPSVSVCVSYEECRVAVGLLERERERECVRVCVCVCVIRGMPSSYRSVGESECVCWAGPSLCVCHTRNTGSRRSAGEIECGVGQVHLFVRVSYEEYR